jgi:predicted ATPase with chaperone activity
MNTVVADRVVPHPTAPTTLEEAGLNADLVLQLVIKTLHLTGQLTGTELASRLGLRFPVLEPALDQLKNQHHVEISAGSFVGAPSFRYRITDAGRARAALFLEQNHYVGIAPVPLALYQKYLREHELAVPRTATQARVRNAFSHLVLSARVLDQLGPAINAGHSLFVYGPPGNGKTVISQAIRNLLDGDIAIPHALEVEGNIVRVFDPVVHEPLEMDAPGAGLDLREAPDARWIRCRRPLVMVGGELTLAHMELSYNPIARFYHAPVQALANGGVLVIDDFGRQQAPPQALLNRWIVPLESRVDFLTLQTGQKFELPFNVLMVFATNIKPQELVDEAFLRRIHYKVFAESPTVEDFALIFRNCCEERGIGYDRSLVDSLLQTYYRPRGLVLRGCHPRDLIDHALSLAAYLGKVRELTPDLLEAACAGYFVDDREAPPALA